MDRNKQEIGVFNRSQAAQFAGVSAPTFDEWLRREGFPAFKSGRRWIIPREPFIRWMEEQAQRRAQL